MTMKKVSKKAVANVYNPVLELGRVYKVTTYLFVNTDEISPDMDFFVDYNTGVFTQLRQTVESKPVTDEF